MHKVTTACLAFVVLAGAMAAACSGADDPDVLRTGHGAGASGGASSSADPTAPDPSQGSSGSSGATSGGPGSSSGTTPLPDAGTPPATTGSSCTSCHGDATRAAVAGADTNLPAAPPKGTKGETATTARAVGAHQAHLAAGTYSKPLACNECHVVPTATNHSNGAVDMAFGTLAKTGGATPAWNGTSCSSAYCHGNFNGGNTAAAPAWTGGGGMTCTSCHGGPPATGDHLRTPHRVACSTCHGNGYSATTVNKALHLNGVKNAGGAGSSITYNAATRACSPTCHGTQTW